MSLDVIPGSVTLYVPPSVIINGSTRIISTVFHIIYLFIHFNLSITKLIQFM